MKLFASLAAIASLLYPLSGHGAETAHARIWCLSLRFDEGSDSFGDTLDLSTVTGTPNGELAPYNGPTYISAFTMDLSGQPISGTMQLDVPPLADLNSNGFNDFFESSQGVSATTSGTYTTAIGNGTVTATWQRGGGSASGSCGLHLVDSIFGDLGTFNHVFHLLEYSGPLAYTPASNTVTGNVNLVQTGDPTSLLQGPVQFAKVATNRFNLLILQPATWTNAAMLTLSFTNSLFRRDPPWTTNYYGFVQFADGDPSTPAPDYFDWILSIDDTNDINHDGTPDFSDDPQGAPPPPAPTLAVSWTATNLLFSVAGGIGHLHQIQQSLSLPATNWQTVISVTLTNSPQEIAVPYPHVLTAFWRALAQ